MANIFEGIWNGICGVGNFVKDTVIDVGKGAVDLVVNLPKHIGNAFKDGTARFADGVEQIKNGGGFSGFMSCVGGVVHGFTPAGWVTDTFNDVAQENTELVTDELGNSAYVANEHASTGLFSSLFRNAVNTDLRAQKSISDAMEAGDAGAMNMAMLGQLGSTGTAVLSQAAMVGGIVCEATGVGAPIGIALQAGSAGLSMASTYIDDSLAKADLESDIDRAIEKDIKELTESGVLTEENRDEYAEYLTKFYNTTSIGGLGQVGAMSKEDFNALAAGNGLLDMSSGGTNVADYDNSQSGTYRQYADYYSAMAADGTFSADQVDRLSSLGAMHDAGEIDEETYYTNMHLIQYENFDMSEDQAMTLAVMDAYVDMGQITQEEHAELLRAEPVFDSLRQADGSIYAPMKQDVIDRIQEASHAGLEQSVVSSDLPKTRGGAYQDEDGRTYFVYDDGERTYAGEDREAQSGGIFSQLAASRENAPDLGYESDSPSLS